MLRRVLSATSLLLLVEFFDELYAGAVGLSAPGIQTTFAASYTEVSATLLFVPALVALFVEPYLFVLADRYPRGWFLGGGTALMGLAGILASLSSSLPWLSAAITLAYLGSGAGVALAQATLVDAFPDEREQKLARWTLLGELGDLCAPLLMGAVALAGGGWRLALFAVSLTMLAWAGLWLFTHPTAASEGSPHEAPTPALDSSEAEEEEPSVLEALRLALRRRDLLGWLAAATTCDLMDDLLTVFVVFYLGQEHGAGPLTQSLVVGAGVLGSVCGLLAAERVFFRRFTSFTILWVTSALCAASFGWWLLADTTFTLTLSFFAVGFTAAPMYPITIGRAYAALPGQSGTVNAVGHLFSPLSLLFPLAMGLIADQWGVLSALCVVLLQPLALFIVGLSGARAELRRQRG